jgi:hypothetical protein
MPAKSKKQQMAAGAALAAKRGEKSKSSLRGASKSMEKSMSEKQLKEFAGTKRKKLPTKKNGSKSAGKKSGKTKSASSAKSRAKKR